MGMASNRYARTRTGVSTGAAPALHPDTLVRTVVIQTVSKSVGNETKETVYAATSCRSFVSHLDLSRIGRVTRPHDDVGNVLGDMLRAPASCRGNSNVLRRPVFCP